MVPCDTVPPADPRPTVLLAEPDRLRGALIVAGIEDLGIDVVWATDGDTAIDVAAETPFDAHVVDPSLRATDGERVVELLVTEHPSVPLVVTGSSTAILRLASTRLPATNVVDLVRTALDGQGELGAPRGHRRPEAGASIVRAQ